MAEGKEVRIHKIVVLYNTILSVTFYKIFYKYILSGKSPINAQFDVSGPPSVMLDWVYIKQENT